MEYYFRLQYRILRRSVEETGLPFFMAFVLSLLFFAALYYFLLHYPHLSQIAVPYLALSLLLARSDLQRLEFIQSQFSKSQFHLIRLLENVVVVLPFVILTIVVGYWFSSLLSLVFAAIFAVIKPASGWGKVLPTPFRLYPFEFIVLFRRRLWLLLILIAILSIGMYVDNFNLAVVIFAVMILTVAAEVYNVIEPEHILWNFSKRRAGFLKHKLYRGCLQFFLVLMPFFIALSVRFTDKLLWLLLSAVVGCLVLILLLFIKYAIYPRQVGLLESFIFVLAAAMPLSLTFLFPYYFIKAKRNLEKYHD